MRVLRISHSAAVEEWRGRERALTDLGVDVHLLSAPTEEVGGTLVTLVPVDGEQVEPVGRWGKHPALFVYDPRPIWRALGESWDVIDIHEEPFALATAEVLLLRALRRNRSPFVLYTAQNLWKRYPIPFRWLERSALRGAAGVSACSSDAARIAEEKGFPGRARVIPLGVDRTRFSPRDRLGAATTEESDAVTVGFVGRLVPEKGADLLLDAAAVDPRLIVRIAGDGPAQGRLLQHCADLGIGHRVHFDGALAPDELPGFYRTIDVLAVPSLPTARWTEQFGRVAVEAMACGVPVVASDAGALPDVVGGAGIVVPHGNAAALGRAIAEAAGPRSEELRTLGFRRVEQCSWEAVADDYLALYSAATHGRSRAAAVDVEVLIVAYGRPDLLRAALEPVAKMPVTVVDNSSAPEIAALCAELNVRYIDAGRNRGFAGGVNLGIADRLRPHADLLLLNPDALVSPAQIEILHRALRADASLASVAPAQIDDEGRPTRVSWPFPSPAGAWMDAIGLGRFRRGSGFVIGSVLMLRAEALDQLGGLDESFFLYSEETDWAYRAQLRGWRHAEVTSVTAVHAGAATSTDPVRRLAHFHASQERYFRKHYGTLGWQIARAAVWTGAMARAAVLSGEDRRDARRRAALYRLGPARVEQTRYPGETR